MQLPQRVSLVAQVAEILRHDILAGKWPERLPGELHLSDQLQVSRSTLRAAFATLQKEGLLAAGQGRHRRPSTAISPTIHIKSTVVGVLSPVPLHQQSAHTIIILDELRRHLQQAGFSLQVHVVPQSGRGVSSKKLQQLVAQTDAACWVLSSCSLEVQQWFADARLRTLVQGSCHPGITLPYIRCDVAAACRHAVSAVRRHGHTRIALLLPDTPFAGAKEIETAFRSTCADLPSEGIFVRFQTEDPTATERTVRRLLLSEKSPTAFVTMMPRHALTAFCVLRAHGSATKQTVSLVSLFDDPLLAFVTPRLARYHYNDYAFSRKMAGIVLRIIRRGALPPSVSTLPSFIEGGTLDRVPPQI